jgi:hypothetical protein
MRVVTCNLPEAERKKNWVLKLRKRFIDLSPSEKLKEQGALRE